MDVVLTGTLVPAAAGQGAQEGDSIKSGRAYSWAGHWYFKGSKSRTNGFTYTVRFTSSTGGTEEADLSLAHAAWTEWKQQELPVTPAGTSSSGAALTATEGHQSECVGTQPPPSGAVVKPERTSTGPKSGEVAIEPPQDATSVSDGGVAASASVQVTKEGDRSGEKEVQEGSGPSAPAAEGDDQQEAQSVTSDYADSMSTGQNRRPSFNGTDLDPRGGLRGRPLCPNPLGSLCSSGTFTVHSTVPATHITEEFVLKMSDTIGAVGQVGIEGEGTNIYGQFTLKGTLTLPLNKLILHRHYKTERKPRKPKTKVEAPPVVASERRASQRITFGVRKRPLFADEEDEDGTGDPSVAASGCPAGKLLAIARMIRRKNLYRGFERWIKLLPQMPAASKRAKLAKAERIVQGGSNYRCNTVTSGVQRSRHYFEPKFRPTANWFHAFLDEEGEIYEGEMLDGWRHGMGVCMYPNGFMYQGHWKRGREHGRGKLMTADRRTIYEGEWLDGKMHGKGKYTFKSGACYEGDFKENLRHGQGTYQLPDAAGVYRGEWREDLRWGYGCLTWANGATYEGDWTRGVRHGRGTLRWSDGFEYCGQWAQNEMDGRGACEYADQQRYEGIWKQGRKEGRGTLRFPNGAFYEGRFRDDQIDGQGTIEIKTPVEDVVPGDWIIPLDIQVDVGRAHKKAGFDKEGL